MYDTGDLNYFLHFTKTTFAPKLSHFFFFGLPSAQESSIGCTHCPFQWEESSPTSTVVSQSIRNLHVLLGTLEFVLCKISVIMITL
jgi:hypothetical protein